MIEDHKSFRLAEKIRNHLMLKCGNFNYRPSFISSHSLDLLLTVCMNRLVNTQIKAIP